MVGLGLLEVGQQLGASIISHWQLEMVQENHRWVIKVILLRFVELDIPLLNTPYKNALKKVQLN
jgi:hypothetical protein